jgi:hypothetical protein
LLAEDDWRSALPDESEEIGPDVALVFGAFSFAG